MHVQINSNNTLLIRNMTLNMRDIWFRGKRIDNDEWVHGYLVRSGKRENGIINKVFYIAMNRYDEPSIFNKDSCDDTFIWRRVDPDTVGQYTGRKDINGIQIYEDDIVETQFGRLCKVVWRANDQFLGFDLLPLEDKNKAPNSWEVWNSKNLRVVGNIYDNLETLSIVHH